MRISLSVWRKRWNLRDESVKLVPLPIKSFSFIQLGNRISKNYLTHFAWARTHVSWYINVFCCIIMASYARVHHNLHAFFSSFELNADRNKQQCSRTKVIAWIKKNKIISKSFHRRWWAWKVAPFQFFFSLYSMISVGRYWTITKFARTTDKMLMFQAIFAWKEKFPFCFFPLHPEIKIHSRYRIYIFHKNAHHPYVWDLLPLSSMAETKERKSPVAHWLNID